MIRPVFPMNRSCGSHTTPVPGMKTKRQSTSCSVYMSFRYPLPPFPFSLRNSTRNAPAERCEGVPPHFTCARHSLLPSSITRSYLALVVGSLTTNPCSMARITACSLASSPFCLVSISRMYHESTIGVAGLEPATSGSPNRRSTRLSYTPRDRCPGLSRVTQRTHAAFIGTRPGLSHAASRHTIRWQVRHLVAQMRTRHEPSSSAPFQ